MPELIWKGKEQVINHHLKVPVRTLFRFGRSQVGISFDAIDNRYSSAMFMGERIRKKKCTG